MEAAIQTTDQTTEKDAMETLFSYLDKGIDDMESGRVHTMPMRHPPYWFHS